MIKKPLVFAETVFEPEQVAFLHDPRGMILQIHPGLFMSGVDDNGRQEIGFHAFGAEHVIGSHVLVEATPFALPRVIEAAHDLIFDMSSSTFRPSDGKKVDLASGVSLRVLYADADDIHPRPYIRLQILNVPASGGQDVRGTGPAEDLLTYVPEATAKPSIQNRYWLIAGAILLYLFIGNFHANAAPITGLKAPIAATFVC